MTSYNDKPYVQNIRGECGEAMTRCECVSVADHFTACRWTAPYHDHAKRAVSGLRQMGYAAKLRWDGVSWRIAFE